MEFQQLRYFLEVAKRQHVTKSAEALHVVQPAITKAINRLEDELGVQLFTPQGRGIRLTPSGRYLYEEVQPIMEQLEALPERIREVETQESTTVRLNMRAAWTLATDAVVEYQRIDHLLDIEVTASDESDAADITITTRQAGRALFRHKYAAEQSFREKIYLAVPNLPRYRGRAAINLQEVRESRFITLSSAQHFRAICDTICETAGIHPHFVFESDSPAAVMNAISMGMGVGFWPAFSWIKAAPARILLLEVEQVPCCRDIIISRNHERRNDIHIRLFYDYLCKYFALYSGGVMPLSA